MIRKALALLVVPLLFWAKGSDSLTSGWLAQEKDFQSAIQIWTIDKNKPKFLCSGVAIAPDTVLTAKSCIYGPDNTQKEDTLFISTKPVIDYKMSLKQALQSITFVAKGGIPHPDADLMIIFLNQWLNVEPAIIMTPAEVFQIRLLPQVFLVGFGQNESEQNDSQNSDNFFWKWWSGKKPPVPGHKFTAKSQIVQVEARELQLGSAQDDGAACMGDEGGPVFAHIESAFANSQRLLGIFTSSPNQKKCSKPSTALRLDAFRDFINETMVQECRKKERIWCQIEGLISPGYNDEPQADKSERKPEISADDKEPISEDDSSEEASKPAPVPPAPEPPKATDPEKDSAPKPAPPAQKPIKRRLKVSAEGAGCSCSQVFTKRRQ